MFLENKKYSFTELNNIYKKTFSHQRNYSILKICQINRNITPHLMIKISIN